MSLPNYGNKFNQLCGQIKKIWKYLGEEIGSIIIRNPDGTTSIGTFQNPISSVVLNSEVIYGAQSKEAFRMRNSNMRDVWKIDQNGYVADPSTRYIGLIDEPYYIIRDSDGIVCSITDSTGTYAKNQIGWSIPTYASWQDFLAEVFPNVPYSLPPSSQLA